MLFAPAPPPPVSYSQQIAPLLALRCYSCHGDSGGLSLRTHAALLLGGNLGKVVLPGNPDGSLLVHFIEGRRGTAHRMPLEGRPLSRDQIQMIRRWIAQGAKADMRPVPKLVRTIAGARFDGATLRVYGRIKTPAFLTVTARDPRNGRLLFQENATVKTPKERGDAAEPGEQIVWEIHSGMGWPRTINLQLTVEYAIGKADGVEFGIVPAPSASHSRAHD